MKLDDEISNTLPIFTGVPQGSIILLGPLLFMLYKNDLHIASHTFKAILYADDTMGVIDLPLPEEEFALPVAE